MSLRANLVISDILSPSTVHLPHLIEGWLCSWRWRAGMRVGRRTDTVYVGPRGGLYDEAFHWWLRLELKRLWSREEV